MRATAVSCNCDDYIADIDIMLRGESETADVIAAYLQGVATVTIGVAPSSRLDAG